MKLRNGSLRNFVPDHYALGYLLTGYGREKYGENFWKKVTDDAARFNGIFYPFQRAVKKYSGVSFSNFVGDAMRFYKDQNPAHNTGAFITHGNPRFVSNYVVPYFSGNDSILVLKKTYRDIPAWYWLTAKGEKKIAVKDIGLDDYYSFNNGNIVYTAYEPDARWPQRDFSVIKMLNVYSKEVKQVTHRSKYFTPDISKDGKRIIAAQYLPDQQAALHIIDAGTGDVLQKIPATDDHTIFSYPKFYDSSRIIVSVRNNTGMMNIAMINLADNHSEYLLPWSYAVNGFVSIKHDTVYYSGSDGSYDNIFAVDVNTRKISQLTNESLGAYQPTVNETGKLVWSSFTADGYQLKEQLVQPGDREPGVRVASVNTQNLFLPNALQQTGGDVLQHISKDSFPVSTYSKFSSFFNFHSWRPYYEQPEWSFTVYGENILNTFQSRLYYVYNENEGSHQTGFSGTFGGLYPWITGGISYTLDRKGTIDSGNIVRWDELNANIGLSIPFNFTKGKWYKYLTVSSTFNTEQLNVKGGYKDRILSHFNYLESSISWTSQLQRAVQHINPRFAQSFFLRYRTMVNKYTANQFLATGSIYLPGVVNNHSLVLTGAFQQRDTSERYRFSNSFPFARGYDALETPRMWKGGVNYHFPLAYPDWGFGQIVYFSRIRANVFFDYAPVANPTNKKYLFFQECRNRNIF